MDGDRAGFEATQRFTQVFSDLKVSVIKMPDGMDPCLMLQADQVEELRALCQRFLDHMAGQYVIWERLEDYARRRKS